MTNVFTDLEGKTIAKVVGWSSGDRQEIEEIIFTDNTTLFIHKSNDSVTEYKLLDKDAAISYTDGAMAEKDFLVPGDAAVKRISEMVQRDMDNDPVWQEVKRKLRKGQG